MRVFKSIFLICFAGLAVYSVYIYSYYYVYKRNVNATRQFVDSINFNFENFITQVNAVTIFNSLQLLIAVLALAFSAPVFEYVKNQLSEIQFLVKKTFIVNDMKVVSWKVFIKNNSKRILDFDLHIFAGNHNWLDSYGITISPFNNKNIVVEVIENNVKIKNLIPQKWIVLKFSSHETDNIKIYKDRKYVRHRILQSDAIYGFNNILLYRDYAIAISRVRVAYILLYATIFVVIIILRILYLSFT